MKYHQRTNTEVIEVTRHARGVRAVRDLGGQVPQKYIAEADRTLRRAGLAASERKLPKTGQVAFIERLYEKKPPVVGDSFTAPNGNRIEITGISPTPTGGTSIDYMEMFGKGKIRTLHVEKKWAMKAKGKPN